MTSNTRPGREEIARQVFRGAAGDIEPEVSRIADAVPEMIAEARRRRATARRVDPIAAVVPLARRAIPAMTAAAVVLVVFAAAIGMRDINEVDGGATGLDSLILTGEVGGEVSDVLLEAMADLESDNG